jgi:hypothetical protein
MCSVGFFYSIKKNPRPEVVSVSAMPSSTRLPHGDPEPANPVGRARGSRTFLDSQRFLASSTRLRPTPRCASPRYSSRSGWCACWLCRLCLVRGAIHALGSTPFVPGAGFLSQARLPRICPARLSARSPASDPDKAPRTGDRMRRALDRLRAIVARRHDSDATVRGTARRIGDDRALHDRRGLRGRRRTFLRNRASLSQPFTWEIYFFP